MTPDPVFPDASASCFEVLGVGASVDDATLSRALRSRLRTWHPDRFGADDETLRAEAEWASALANDAFRRLADPFDRAEYLLLLERGVRPDALKSRVDPELFGDMLEIQERCEDLDGTDAPGLRAALESDLVRLERDIAALASRLALAFEEYDAGSTDSALEAISDVVPVRGYLRRARESVALRLGLSR